VGLVARALEINGIASVLTSWNNGLAGITAPPRYTVTNFKRGCTLGTPGDSEQQLRVLKATLALLEKDGPLEKVTLEESLHLDP